MRFINDLMLAIGGRKFLLSILCIVAAVFIELKTDRGITPAFAGMVVSILAAFSASNVLSTNSFLKSKQKKDPNEDPLADLTAQVNELKTGVANTGVAIKNVHDFLVAIVNSGMRK